jgi:hypothetical protein
MTQDPDLPQVPKGSPWWWRALARAGVLSVWGAGLTVCVVALALVGAIWLSRQPAGHRLTFAFANRALAGSSNLRLSAQRSLLIEHGAYLVSPVVDIVDSSGTRRPFLTATRARLITSWWGLLSRNPQDVRVELEDPVFTLTRRGKKGYLLPEFKSRTPSGREPSPIAIDLGIKNGIVRIVGADAPTDTLARALDLTGRMHGAGKTWEFALGRFAAFLPVPSLEIEKAEGRMRVADDRLALDHLRMRTGAGWIEAEGAGSVKPQFDLEGRVKAGEWTWHDLARLLRQPALDIPGGIAGDALVHVRPDTLSLSGAQAEVLWRGEPGHASFDGTWSKGRLALEDARVTWRNTEFAGGFTLEPKLGTWRLAGALERLDLAELPRLWPMPKLEPAVLSGDLDLAADKRGLFGRVARARGTWRDLAFDSLGGTWALASGVQSIDARARAAGASLAAKGTIGAKALAGTVRVAGLEGERVPASWWRDLGLAAAPKGRVEMLEAQLAGAPARPTARGTALVTGVEQGGLLVSRGRLAFDGTLGSSYALHTVLTTGAARAGFTAADTVETEATITPRRIEVPRFWAQRAESTLTAQGSATRAGNDWDVRIDRLAWEAGERIQLDNDGPIEFAIEPGGTLAIRHARVVSNAGALSASGRWGGDRAASDLALDLETLDLESLLGPVAAQYQVRGVLTGQARLEGPAGRAVWTVDLDAGDLHYRTYTARHLVARGRFADDAWRVEKLELDTGQGRLSFTGDLTWDERPPWSGTPEAWNQALIHAPRWSGTLTTDSLSLGQISEFYPQAGGWRGLLSVTAQLSGRPSAPLATVRGKLLKPGWGQGSLDDFDLDLDYRDELLTVRRFAMVGSDSLGPTVTGTLPIRMGWGIPPGERLPDRPMALNAHARGLDLGLVPLLIPQIAAASGRMDLDAILTGTPRAPVAQGTIFVRDGVVRPANREEVLTGVTGTIHLAGSELKIAHFEAHQGKQGRLTVAEGIGHLKDLRLADYAFDLDASHVTAFSSGEYVIELDGKFHVRNGADLGGPLPLPHITGNATVIEGVFLTNFADPDRQAAWQGPAVVPPWTYDVAVEARNNVWWRPAEANIEGKLTDFEIIQGLDRFLLLGQVDALRGRYYFLGNQFDVTTGSLFFDATQPMDPTVNAVLTTEKNLPLSQGRARETITLSVTGRAHQPTVTLSSSPSSLSQTEIATLLTYGQLQGGASAIGQAGAQYLIRQLARGIPELADFEVGSKVDDQNNATTAGTGSSRLYTTVGVSRYFTRDLLLRYSQVVGDVAEAQRVDYQDLAAEYRINRLLFLSGQVTRRKGVLVTSQDQTLYNLDVRARYEY